MSAFTSLHSATEPSTGESRQLLKATAHHTMIVTIAGDVSSCVIVLEGSHDGFEWVPMQTHQAIQNGMVTTQPSAHLVTHVRASLVALNGGDDARVTASIASADDA